MKMPESLIGYTCLCRSLRSHKGKMETLIEEGCSKVFVDYGSGKNRVAHQFYAALKELRQGDTLTIIQIDDLRLPPVEMRHLIQKLTTTGIFLRSISEKIDTSTASGAALLACLIEGT